MPLLRHIAAATAGTERSQIDRGVLATTLWQAGRTAEAETLLRELIDESVAKDDYRIASTAAGELLNLLMTTGCLPEALTLATTKAEYTRQAGLGPWTQQGDENRRLQVLAALGRYTEVLDAVEALRPQLATLPLTSDANETANPWNVREGLLDTGREAAMRSEQWDIALALNAGRLQWKAERGADVLELARTRFNDYGPLLRLGRISDARNLLLACRDAFTQERDVFGLGKVYSARADLEDKTGNRPTAVRFEDIALRYSYQAGQPEDCAISHNNLANYLKSAEAAPALVLAHRLAAAAIRLQMQSGLLPTTISNLANADLPPAPPPFAAVVATVEQIDGVRFGALFDRLPRTVPDGDAAIAAVGELVLAEKAKRAATAQRREHQKAVLATLPPAIQAAFALEGENFGIALKAALADLPAEEADAVLQQLRDADLISGGSSGPDMAQVLEAFEPLLQAIAAAVDDVDQQAALETELADWATKGWQLTDLVHRLWAGERDVVALTADIDGNSAQLVQRLLVLVTGCDGDGRRDAPR